MGTILCPESTFTCACFVRWIPQFGACTREWIDKAWRTGGNVAKTRDDVHLVLCRLQHLYQPTGVDNPFISEEIVLPTTPVGKIPEQEYPWGRVPIVWRRHFDGQEDRDLLEDLFDATNQTADANTVCFVVCIV